MRLFIAVELAGPAKDEVLSVRERLVETVARQGVRFVKPEKLHLTLAFLGSVDEAKLGELMRELNKVAVPPFRLQLSGLGCFPDMRRPKVIWLGLDGDASSIQTLATKVTAAAKPFAPELDEKPYSPHVTLARVSPGSKEVGRMLTHLAIDATGAELPVDSFTLFQSKPDGTYEALHKVSF